MVVGAVSPPMSTSAITMDSASPWTAAAPGWQRRTATAAVMMGLVVGAIEGTAVTSIVPAVARTLNGLSLYPWVFAAYLLGSTLAVPLAGKFGDRVGRKPVFIVGMGTFVLGSLACAAAPTMGWLIAARALAGIGTGATATMSTTMTADLYSLRERARVQGLFTGAWGLSNLAGPALGAFVAHHAGWRAVFLLSTPVGLASIALLYFSYRDAQRGARRRIDVLGALQASAALVMLLVAIEPRLHVPWTVRAAAVAVVALVALAFVRRQRSIDDPLISVDTLRDPTVRACVAGSLFAGIAIFVPAAYVPYWIVTERHGSTYDAGLALLPSLLGWATGSTFGVRLLVVHGIRRTALAGLLLATVGAAGLALAVSIGAPIALAYASLFSVGAGLGPAANAFLLGSQSRVAWTSRSAVSGLVQTARALGGSLGVALLAALGAWHSGGSATRFAGLALLLACGVVVTWRLAPRSELAARDR